MKLKKILPVALSITLVTSSFALALPQGANAQESKVKNKNIEDVTNVNTPGYEMIDLVDVDDEGYEEGGHDFEMVTIVDPNEPKTFTEAIENFKTGEQKELGIIPTKKKNGIGTNVVISDGAIFTWDYYGTTYGNNVFQSDATYFLTNAFIAGLSATVVGKVGSKFFAGSAGWAFGKLSVPQSAHHWYTVKKWKDEDAYNVYFRYEIKYYSDSARTKLLKTLTYVERAN